LYAKLKSRKIAITSTSLLVITIVSISLIFNAQASTNTCKCVAFRFDDVQDYYLYDVQISVMDEFASHDLDLTIGVIGNYFGDDQRIVSYVKQGAASGRLEIANHGWNHESFVNYTREEQSRLIDQTNGKLYAILGVRPEGFIAPFNAINSDTLEAAKENKIVYISANVTMDKPSYRMLDGLYHYPQTATTGNLNDDDTEWLGFDHETTMKDIRQSVKNHGFAVVNMHPMEFAARDGLQYSDRIDERQLVELAMLLFTLQQEEYEIVTMSELARRGSG
jgi:peptidoglycan/xylan/chitin deacetylase (PgdA/CDA1 family)